MLENRTFVDTWRARYEDEDEELGPLESRLFTEIAHTCASVAPRRQRRDRPDHQVQVAP